MKSFITMSSSTQAMKAASLAKSMKINVIYTKRTDETGCHFGLETDYDPDRFCRILALHGVRCIKIIRMGDEE